MFIFKSLRILVIIKVKRPLCKKKNLIKVRQKVETSLLVSYAFVYLGQ